MDFREITEFLKDSLGFIILIVAVFLIAMYVVGLQQVVGPSMEPTLNDQDVLLISKIHYAVFNVKRNDIVAIDSLDNKYLIKRVIGMPGENVEYKNNLLYINGESFEETLYEDMVTEDFKLSDMGYDEIPEDHYLVLGDNRGNSLDSRDESVGLVSKDEIIGKTIVRIWPLNGFKIF